MSLRNLLAVDHEGKSCWGHNDMEVAFAGLLDLDTADMDAGELRVSSAAENSNLNISDLKN